MRSVFHFEFVTFVDFHQSTSNSTLHWVTFETKIFDNNRGCQSTIEKSEKSGETDILPKEPRSHLILITLQAHFSGCSILDLAP